MVKESILDIDEIDAKIIQILQKSPDITHSKIAEELDRSQPTIGLRIKKLEKKGFISQQFGMDLSKIKAFNVVKVQVRHPDPTWVFELPRKCPFILNAFRQSGKYNCMLILVCPSLKKIDNIIGFHFRSKGNLCDLETELLTDFSDSFILPIDIRAIIDGRDEEDCSPDKCPCYLESDDFLPGKKEEEER